MEHRQKSAQDASERVCAGHTAAEDALTRLATLISQSPHNLVARGERAHVREVHIAEAEAVHGALTFEPGSRWMDLGTGGGLPGLVLATLVPHVSWVLLDATTKKITAVEEFAQELGLRNVTTVAARAEELAHDPTHRGTYDGVISRAVAGLPTLLELARGFLRSGGTFAAIKGPAWRDELDRAELARTTLRYGTPTGTAVEEAVRRTWLVRMPAVGSPPAGFPRRTGQPRTNPIGVSG